MSYKLLKITSCYKDFITRYYRNNPGIVQEDYAGQFAHFVEHDYAWSNFYSIHFPKWGVDVMEVFHNLEPMQTAWAREHGVRPEQSVVLAQAKTFQPDVVFFQDVASFSPAFFQQLRAEVPTVRLMFGHYCTPVTEDTLPRIASMDFMLACSEYFIEVFSANHIRSFLYRHAFEASIAERAKINNTFPEEALLFTGSFFKTSSSGWHDERLRIMEEIVRNDLPLRIYGNLDISSMASMLPRQIFYLLVLGMKNAGLKRLVTQNAFLHKFYKLPEMPRRSKYSSRFLSHVIQEPLFGLDMYKATSRAKISLNVHGNGAGEYAANMRMFEITGVGSLMVTDHKKNISALFEPDKEIVTFTNATDCVEKLRWLLDHPAAAVDIAKAGQARTMREHTFEKRVEYLNGIILEELKKK